MTQFPNQKYKIIYADPPWSYTDKALNRGGALRHYPTMDIEQIAQLPIQEIADKDCALFMWVTMPKLNQMMPLLKSWGFQYKTCAFVWVKTNKKSETLFWGMGRWTRSNAELCVIATKGTPKRIAANIHSVITAPVERHSKKPDIVRRKIVQLMGDLPRIELFARETSEGWDSWGNEIES